MRIHRRSRRALSDPAVEPNHGDLNWSLAPAPGFIAQHALSSQGLQGAVPVQSYWTFSDIFEEGGPSKPNTLASRSLRHPLLTPSASA